MMPAYKTDLATPNVGSRPVDIPGLIGHGLARTSPDCAFRDRRRAPIRTQEAPIARFGTRMRILKIYDGDYPWDVRVEKMLRTLTQAGHEVTLVARNRQRRPRRGVLDDPPSVAVRRLPRGDGPAGLLSFPFFANPLWVREVRDAARVFRPERILVRDLPLAPLAVWLGRRLQRRVFVDMAEPYPLALRSNWQFDGLGGIDHLVRNVRLADAVERWVVRRAPHVFVVAEEAAERLRRLGLPVERLTLVRNTPDLARLDPRAAAPPPWLPELAGRRIVLFTGILVGDRGLDVAIEALARLLQQRGPVAALVVAGDGRARPDLEAAARRAGIEASVRFLGWTPHEALPGLCTAADVGILPFHDCPHIQTTLANKLFDYMAAGLPVLASDVRPMARVLRETGAGATFRAGDAADLAAALGRLLEDASARRRMAESGREACRREFHWGRDGQRLLEALETP
jgi:glycosyltransferase involved in cell wall biosynthesis